MINDALARDGEILRSLRFDGHGSEETFRIGPQNMIKFRDVEGAVGENVERPFMVLGRKPAKTRTSFFFCSSALCKT